ncbi:MAG: hypothetical protein E7607_08920 [Ruminococcaceae bacterium]|nr:hypothetical protein [Oscillospiraceae bacterium]
MKRLWITVLTILAISIFVTSCGSGKHNGENNNTVNQDDKKELKYELNEAGDGYLVVNAGNYPLNAEEIVIPAEYQGKPVIGIAKKAFSFNHAKRIELPNSIKIIGENAFENCYYLTGIVIPDSVESIGANAFKDCIAFTEITVPESVSYMGEGVFEYCNSLVKANIPSKITAIAKETFNCCNNLTEVSLHNGITAIGDDAFAYCYALKNVNIPDSVTEIGAGAFSGCKALEKIVISESVKRIGNGAFGGCTAITEIYIPDTIEEIGQEIFSSENIVTATVPADFLKNIPKSKLQFLTVKGGGAIPDGVFKDYSESLTTLIIEDGVTGIGDYAFHGERNLVSIVMSDDVEYIGEGAFSGCRGLKNVLLSNKLSSVGIEAFDDCDSLEYNEYDNAYYLGTDSNKYVYCAKAVNSDITEVQIHNDARIIGDYAFSGCKSLENVSFYNWLNAPNPQLISIGAHSFYNCEALKDISIPDKVISIGANAFERAKMNTLRLPESIEKIGSDAFSDARIGSAYVADLVKWCEVDLGYRGEYIDTPLNVAEHAYIGGEEIINLRIPKEVERIEPYTFCNIESLKSITFEEGSVLKSLSGFSGCKNLESVILPDGVESIGGFEHCGITGIYLPDSVEIIEYRAFYNCPLSAINLPSSLKKIEDDAFYNTDVVSIVVPDSVVEIGNQAFCNTKLQSVTIGRRVRKIGEDAFQNGYLIELNIFDMKSWCQIEFDNVRSNPLYRVKKLHLNGELVTELIIPEGITEIGKYAFWNCESIVSVRLPNTLERMGNSVFANNTNLVFNEYGNAYYLGNDNNPYMVLMSPVDYEMTSYEIHEDTKIIADSALSGCINLESIAIPKGVKRIGEYAFAFCWAVDKITVEDGNARYRGVGNCLIEVESKTLVFGANNSVIPSDGSVTKIDNSALSGRKGLTSINIPVEVTEIGVEAFDGCDSLTSIVYNGAKEQWWKVKKGSGWNSHTGAYTITCTDGVLQKS